MNARRAVYALLGAALLVAAAGREARAQAPSDLTGTWEGRVSCSFTLAEFGTTAKGTNRQTLLLRQVSVGPNGAEYAALFENVPGSFSARTIDVGGAGSGKGVMVMADCDDSDDA
jgi:hypothetical protein